MDITTFRAFTAALCAAISPAGHRLWPDEQSIPLEYLLASAGCSPGVLSLDR